MRKFTFTLGVVTFLCLVLSVNTSTNASLPPLTQNALFTYAIPTQKPIFVAQKDTGHDTKHLDKKQAAIAALGLYLGYKAAKIKGNSQ